MPQSEPFVGLSVSAFAHGQPRRLRGDGFSPSRDHLPLLDVCLLPLSAPFGAVRSSTSDLPTMEMLCRNPPDFSSVRGAGTGGCNPRRKLFLRSGRGRVPCFPLGPLSLARGIPGLGSGDPGCSVPYSRPSAEPPPALSCPFCDCQCTVAVN